MSYDVAIVCPCCQQALRLESPRKFSQGTIQVDPLTREQIGSDVAEVNITYNYGKHYSRVLAPEGLAVLHGQPVEATLESLRRAVAALGDDESDDYWQPTEGNAKRALSQLVAMAEGLRRGQAKGVWHVS